MEHTHFGTSPDGQSVDIITLDSGAARCRIITYGAAIVSLEVPDRNGVLTDVVLGFDSLEAYLSHGAYMGAVVGRCANRIGGSRFTLYDTEYVLNANEPPNHLHGGTKGFDKYVWEASEIPDGVRLSHVSPHMDEGYPGTLKVEVEYKLSGTALSISYRAISDRDTVCNLTNHAYFNLDGHDSGSILDHKLTLFAEYFTPVSDKHSIPTGEIAYVDGTPMDFRTPTPIGARIDAPFEQLSFGSGYDHNWIVNGSALATLRPAAVVESAKTGISMRVLTTMPGIQFYSGNFLGGVPTGKGGATYSKRGGLCLETQFYPDSINKPKFPSPELYANEPWFHATVYSFGK